MRSDSFVDGKGRNRLPQMARRKRNKWSHLPNPHPDIGEHEDHPRFDRAGQAWRSLAYMLDAGLWIARLPMWLLSWRKTFADKLPSKVHVTHERLENPPKVGRPKKAMQKAKTQKPKVTKGRKKRVRRKQPRRERERRGTRDP